MDDASSIFIYSLWSDPCLSCFIHLFIPKESLTRDILQRLHDWLVHILESQFLDIEGLQFVCHQDLVLLSTLGDIVDVGEDILSALTDLNTVIQQVRKNEQTFVTGFEKMFSWASMIDSVSRDSHTSY